MAIIKINKENLFYNLDVISKHCGSKDKVAIVLKDNAYGHGLIQIANLAKEFGIKKAVVRTLNEAKQIEELFDMILILAENNISSYSHTFHIVINSLDDIKTIPNGCNVHLKVDTGMHRNGICQENLEEAILGLLQRDCKLKGVMTHHKGADKLSTDFFWQRSVFSRVKEDVKNICEQLKIEIPIFHSCNSAGLFRHTNFDEDFARVGIASYGYLDNADVFEFPKLKPVLSLWAKKISSRVLKKGQSVGYGGEYTAKEDMIISTYDVGYGDGFLRLNERKKYITPKGFEVLGKVSMDNLSLNTNEDEVCIFDNVQTLAKVHDTITYEITTTLNPNIEKEII